MSSILPDFSLRQLWLQEIMVINQYLIKSVKLFHYLHKVIEFLRFSVRLLLQKKALCVLSRLHFFGMRDQFSFSLVSEWEEEAAYHQEDELLWNNYRSLVCTLSDGFWLCLPYSMHTCTHLFVWTPGSSAIYIHWIAKEFYFPKGFWKTMLLNKQEKEWMPCMM